MLGRIAITLTNTLTKSTVRAVTAITLMTRMVTKPRLLQATRIGWSIGTSIVPSRK